MKHLVIFLALLLLSSSAVAQKEGKGNARSGSATRTQSEFNLLMTERQQLLEATIESVEWTPKREPARQMTKEQHALEIEWSKWLLGVRNRLKAHETEIQLLLKKKLSVEEMTEKMAAMNMQFLALQESIQTESRKFTTLSNASKARHDVAMNAIRNMK